MAEEIELENSPGPEEHHRQLCEGKHDVEDQFAGQQAGHIDARTEHAIECAAFGFIEQRAGRAAGREQQKHDANSRSIKGNHGIVLVFAHDRAGLYGDNAAAASPFVPDASPPMAWRFSICRSWDR